MRTKLKSKKTNYRIGQTREIIKFAWFPTIVFSKHGKHLIWLERYASCQMYQKVKILSAGTGWLREKEKWVEFHRTLVV
jgi:hypothetical protein